MQQNPRFCHFKIEHLANFDRCILGVPCHSEVKHQLYVDLILLLITNNPWMTYHLSVTQNVLKHVHVSSPKKWNKSIRLDPGVSLLSMSCQRKFFFKLFKISLTAGLFFYLSCFDSGYKMFNRISFEFIK